MARISMSRVFALVIALAGPMCAIGYAQERAGKASVGVRILGTHRAGATGVSSGGTGGELEVGQAGTYGVYGDFSGALGAGGWPVRGTDTAHAWRVEARLLSLRADSVELAVEWSRLASAAEQSVPEVGDRRVFRLKADERHLLDLVQSDDPASAVANLVVELTAKQVEDPAYAGVSLAYDLWLVHQSRAGEKTTKRVQVAGSQGAMMVFAFPKWGFRLDGTVVPGEGDPPLTLSVGGTVLGRLRPGGGIEVVLDGSLQLGCRSGGIGGGSGTKSYVARDGETVEVELPFGSGYCGTITGESIPPNVRPGVSVFGAGLRVSNREFFEGDRLSLLVAARRQR